jgi:very-short-patch-repair endonuclease
VSNPSPTIHLRKSSGGRSPLSRKGRGLREEGPLGSSQSSPLAGEGRALARGEGAANSTLAFAKKLRREMTDAETKLWQELRAKRFENYKFKRQQPIGKYIADFVNFDHRVIIEVDGSQHDESDHDAIRDAWLKSQGFRTLRFWNIGVLKEMDGALLSILAALKEPT